MLKRKLGLTEEDIIDLPVLFKLVSNSKDVPRALAFYPDMVGRRVYLCGHNLSAINELNVAVTVYLMPSKVNMIVLGKHLGIPKPFGPKVDGQCMLEAEMCSLMEGLGLECTFIDDFASYHKLLGEVHCGSNVRREMFDFKWWNLEM